jgi:uncharacterized phage protein (TIGR01671 family)
MNPTEIKFRAYSFEEKRMLYTDWNSFRNWYDTSDYKGRVVKERGFQSESVLMSKPMQYTTLKDLNGLEIFERDIVKWNDGASFGKERWRVAVVEIKNGTTTFTIVKNTMHELTADEGDVFEQGGFSYSDTQNHLIVCGNTIENLDLLDGISKILNSTDAIGA